MTKVAIIGAGCSGFTTAKRFVDAGIAFDWFEASSIVGGNWAYDNPNGMSAAYQSLHIDTSKTRLQFEDFPVPADWPDFPHHSLLNGYFNAYVDHFGLRQRIRFNTRVTSVTHRADGDWDVATSDGATGAYRAVIVANGHHWAPHYPEYPGNFDGPAIHAHDYRTPTDPLPLAGKRVLVVGLGNSAVDIASELGQRTVAAKLFVSTRRGVWVIPKYFGGKPSDKTPLPHWLPAGLKRALSRWAIQRAIGNMEDYGLPKPDHKPLEAHPTVSSEFLLRLGSGDVTIKPAVSALAGDSVAFVDGTAEPIDAIIYATGYDTKFPFLASDVAPVVNNHIGLYKRMVQADPALHGLWFMGLAQPLPTLVNFAEQQSKLVAAYLTGGYTLPDPASMAQTIAADEALHMGHYYATHRHTMQVDFDVYCADLKREIVAGAKRTRIAA